jgi:hypothetical protein
MAMQNVPFWTGRAAAGAQTSPAAQLAVDSAPGRAQRCASALQLGGFVVVEASGMQVTPAGAEPLKPTALHWPLGALITVQGLESEMLAEQVEQPWLGAW